MCGQIPEVPLYECVSVDRQRGFAIATGAAARIYYGAARIDPSLRKLNKHWKRLKQVRGCKTIPRPMVEKQESRATEAHRSVEALFSVNRAERWHIEKMKAAFSKVESHRPPTAVARKISVMTGSDQWPRPGDKTVSGSQTARTAESEPKLLPPLRSLSARRRSIDLSILKSRLTQRLIPIFDVYDSSKNGSMNEHELKKATDELNLKPYTLMEIKQHLDDHRIENFCVDIDQDSFVKLIMKRLHDKIPRYEAVLAATDRFETLEKYSRPQRRTRSVWAD